MERYLRARPEDSQADKLIKKYQKDPAAVSEMIMKQASDLLGDGETEGMLSRSKQAVSAIYAQMAAELSRFLSDLPVRQSIFRGGEDSKQAYRLLCGLVDRLEALRVELRAEDRMLFLCRERLNERLDAQTKLLGQVELLLQTCSEERLTNLHERLAAAERSTRETVAWVYACGKDAERVDRVWIGGFFEEAMKKSDAAHGGVGCDCTALSVLAARTRSEIERLI
ncbi:MAG: hypothetical protein IJW16_05130 [Clostridia bacterium]|nr:hypothetical protein [Clostridia bacterium]